ncbi:MAG TPA: hypothetical protein VNF07_08480 [Acidimicrobiales bacterium]|nr:hypothetical protein [Acidimicrobiales bacterium]
MTLDAATLFSLVPGYLERQSWYALAVAGDPPAPLELESVELLRDGEPGLARLLLRRGERWLLQLVGWRPATGFAGVLRNEDRSLMGSADDEGTTVIVYDALADDALMRFVLERASGGKVEGHLVRPLATLVSHASLVFDEKVFMKCYRVLERGPRPEVEVLFRLDEAGFNALAAPLGRWREGDFDLALVREFLPSALEGRLLALTSLRDLLAHASLGEEAEGEFSGGVDLDNAERAAASAGGDFASEMRRLGETTARLHVAMATAFGRRELTAQALPPSFERPAGLALGEEIQLHGDFHLRRVMRGETGWLVTGFGDDPLYNESGGAPSSALRRGSCLEDLADMTFALRRVSLEALAQRPEREAPLAGALAAAWMRRNCGAFLGGYLADAGVSPLLPPDQRFRDQLLYAYEQVRERRYEATSAGA